MMHDRETSALIALLRGAKRSWLEYSAELEQAGSAWPLLLDEQGLLAEPAAAEAMTAIDAWARRGIRVLSVLDPAYPARLRASERRPPVLFSAGKLEATDVEAVAVVGTREPTEEGCRAARAIVRRLAGDGATIVSGLAAGIDSVVHRAALDQGARTIAVIGNGLDHIYPRQNAALQREIISAGAVISQFWPEERPSRRKFPMRNGVMAGLTAATVIVEATPLSGTRIQARLALAQGRTVLLLESLLSQPWAAELAERPGVHVVASAGEVATELERLLGARLAA